MMMTMMIIMIMIMLRCHNIIALLSPPHVFALCNKASGDGLGTYFCHDWPVFIVLCSFYFPIVPEGLDFYDFSCWMKVFDIWSKKVQWKREKFSLMVIGETELCWECEKVLFGETSKSPAFYLLWKDFFLWNFFSRNQERFSLMVGQDSAVNVEWVLFR